VNRFIIVHLTTIDVDITTPAYQRHRGVLFNHSHTALIESPKGKRGKRF